MVLPLLMMAIPALISMAGSMTAKGAEASPAELKAEKDMSMARAIARILADPNDPRLLAQAEVDKQKSNYDFSQAITQMQQADRKNRAMGRPATFFDPDRMDENIAMMFGRQAAKNALDSRDSARSKFQDQFNSFMGLAQGELPIGQMQQGRMAAKAQQRQNMFDSAGSIFGAMGGGGAGGAMGGLAGMFGGGGAGGGMPMQYMQNQGVTSGIFGGGYS